MKNPSVNKGLGLIFISLISSLLICLRFHVLSSRASDAEIPSETIHRLLSDIYSCQIDETFYDVIKDGVTEHFAGKRLGMSLQ